MSAKWLLGLLLPLALATTLGACENQGVQPGVVQSASGYRGETGRVVSIREVPLRGRSGMSNGTLVGGGLGAAGGAAIGAATTNSVGGAVVGGLLGAVAGGIAGTAVDQNGVTRRGSEVTVRKDDGSRVTIAQLDDGDVQMGDRVMIVYDRNGVAKAVRDTSYRRD
jgi:outer membrane lipoprotein SlyB